MVNAPFAPEECKPRAELFGTYRFRKTEEYGYDFKIYLHVGPAGEGFTRGTFKIVVVECDGGQVKVSTLLGFAKKFDDYYLVGMPDFKDDGPPEKRWKEQAVENYNLLHLQLNEGVMSLRYLDNEFVKSQIEKKLLSGTIGKDEVGDDLDLDLDSHTDSKTVRITADSEELTEYLKTGSMDELMSKKLVKFEKLD